MLFGLALPLRPLPCTQEQLEKLRDEITMEIIKLLGPGESEGRSNLSVPLHM